jgi:hypothetical protein
VRLLDRDKVLLQLELILRESVKVVVKVGVGGGVMVGVRLAEKVWDTESLVEGVKVPVGVGGGVMVWVWVMEPLGQDSEAEADGDPDILRLGEVDELSE